MASQPSNQPLHRWSRPLVLLVWWLSLTNVETSLCQPPDPSPHEGIDELFAARRFADVIPRVTARLADYQQRYPAKDHPSGHIEIAKAHRSLGLAQLGLGNAKLAAQHLEASLEMLQLLYPLSRYPHGHPDIARALSEVGLCARDAGNVEYGQLCLEKAVAMNRGLYPPKEFPNGHKEIVQSLASLGLICITRRDTAGAEKVIQEAVEMHTALGITDATYNSTTMTATNALGRLYVTQGKYDRAVKTFSRLIEMAESTRIKQQSDTDMAALSATAHNNLAAVYFEQGRLEIAANHFRKALHVWQEAFSDENSLQLERHQFFSFNNLGVISQAAGNWEEARDYFERAVEMAERLYPEQDYPKGRPELLVALNGLAALLLTQGEYTEARTIFERTLGMAERLYSEDQYPSGHPQIVGGLSQLGHVHQSLGDHAQAVAYFTRALEGAQRLYGSTSEGGGTGSGHPELIRQLRNLGLATALAGDLEQAETLLRRARQAAEEMFPDEAYPQGHVQRATTLQHLARVLSARGKDEEAREVAKSMLQMRQRMYPEAEYSRGHPWIATSLRELAAVLHAQHNWTEAAEVLVQAARMEHALAEAFFAGVSEAEALNFTAQNLDSLNRLLSLAPAAHFSPGEQYQHVWLRRGLVERLMRQRQLAVTLPQNDPALQATYDDYLATRRALAQLTFSPAGSQADARLERLRELTATKERLERQLADGVPEFRTALRQAATSYHKLIEQMPDDAIFIDIVHYGHLEFTRSAEGPRLELRTPRYAAFVVRGHGEPLRVELGEATSLDAAVKRWRNSILSEKQDDAAADLAARVFAPLAQHITPETRRIYIAPEGSLSTIPWAALPIPETGELLLEKYAFALCPHGHFLLEQLTAAPTRAGPAQWLLVGDVAYDEQQEEPEQNEFAGAAPAVELQRSAARGNGTLRWNALQGTREELDAVQAAAHAQQASVTRLSGTKATTARLMHELPQARRAHIATHGFFADQRFRSALQLDPRLFEPSVITSERTSVVARNPLLLSGLALAGANLPRPTDASGIAHGDGGILTAEAIAALPLHRLELIVLSACETGPVIGAGGEGVFGLQRAFHTAGAQNVVASLWKVDDRVTARLMEQFYRHLTAGKTPLEALRAAQLAVLYDLSGDSNDPTRAPNLSQTGRLDPKRDRNRRAATRLWAGFVLSGAGKQ